MAAARKVNWLEGMRQRAKEDTSRAGVMGEGPVRNPVDSLEA
jgi:hypothetical protein